MGIVVCDRINLHAGLDINSYGREIIVEEEAKVMIWLLMICIGVL